MVNIEAQLSREFGIRFLDARQLATDAVSFVVIVVRADADADAMMSSKIYYSFASL
jgi:hypothetical protein